MSYHQLFVLSVLAAATFPDFVTPLAPSWDDLRVKHTWDAVPANWETLGNPPSGTTIDLHVALKSHNESALIEALYEVSDPRSPKHVLYNTPPLTMYSPVRLLCCRYGAHLSREQVAQLVAPHTHPLDLINSWLAHHGVPTSSISTSHGGGWLTLAGVPVSQANKLLGASYQLYRHTGTNDTTILRTVGYALPAVLHTHVQTIVPTTHFASTQTMRQTPRRRSVGATADMASREPVTVLSGRDGAVMPSDLRWLYRTVTYVPTATDQNLLGMAGYLGDHPGPQDLRKFMTQCRADAVDATFTVELLNGSEYDPNNPSSEANQNMQYAQAMAYPTPHLFYSIGGEIAVLPGSNLPAPGDPFLVWLNFVLSGQRVPPTISTSYGVQETTTPPEYAMALCNLFAQLGLRGASVIFPSGNNGVGKLEDCIDDDTGSVHFVPTFPASCPYVTSVGGTTGNPEVAVSFSGGGFSNHFPQPQYQQVAVPTYLERLGSKYDGMYNPAGRGIPDIAAQARRIYIVQKNKGYVVSGTSCAAPVRLPSSGSSAQPTNNVQVVAGIISLLNDYLLSIGRSPLGFLNPWLYGVGLPGINDIISGSNPGCGTDGFSAAVGWDPVTGLGTPDFLNLLASLDSRYPIGTQNPALDPTLLAKAP
ncbi:subtilisin-like protein [Lactarius akahatsu]|uniref:tripeptidyl-peptidase II n=1 Tax=Lactarius akahatsu TaxID=416441 RepID=A0AAD4L880_9AGAM|nr:subtilisin-like protein [Lactarius akahatsu]